MPMTPAFDDFLYELDMALRDDIRSSYGLYDWFLFYSSENKPLGPREFLQYWGSLTEFETAMYTLYGPEFILDHPELMRGDQTVITK